MTLISTEVSCTRYDLNGLLSASHPTQDHTEFCEVVDPWGSGQPEFLSYFCLVSTVDVELSPRGQE
jgi:hypothetical protein